MELEKQVITEVFNRHSLHPFALTTLKNYSKNIKCGIDFNKEELNESCQLIDAILGGANMIVCNPKHYHVVPVFLAAWNNKADILPILLDNTIYDKTELLRYKRIAFAHQGYPISVEELNELSLTELEELVYTAAAGNNANLVDRIYIFNHGTLSFAIKGAKEWNNKKLYEHLKFRALSSKEMVQHSEHFYPPQNMQYSFLGSVLVALVMLTVFLPIIVRI